MSEHQAPPYGPLPDAGSNFPAAPLADLLVLSSEERSEFESLQRGYMQSIQPRDAFELTLVQDLIALRWRITRLWAAERSLLDGPEAPAWRDQLSGRNAPLAQLSRLESRLQQQFGQVLRRLHQWRKPVKPAARPRPAAIPEQPVAGAKRPPAASPRQYPVIQLPRTLDNPPFTLGAAAFPPPPTLAQRNPKPPQAA